MVLTFQIDKIDAGRYRAVALRGGSEVNLPEVYSSIEEAIREVAAAVPDGFAYFADVEYGGASSGTISLLVLQERATQVADQLVAIVAEMIRIEQSEETDF
jgi:chaperonin GroEL (HSP60 family)